MDSVKNKPFDNAIDSRLPPGIIEDILVCLPVKPLLRCKSVSRSWRALIQSSYFVDKHIKRSAELNTNHHLILTDINWDKPLNPLNVFASSLEKKHDIFLRGMVKGICTGSCNGLLLLHCYKDVEDVTLWNPFTRTFKKIPYESFDQDQSKVGCRKPRINYGFGYDHIHNDYKVVRIMGFNAVHSHKEMAYEVKVYSLKTNTWKRTEDFIYSRWMDYLQSGVSVSNATHWLLYHHPAVTQRFRIIAFNFGTDKLQDLPFPPIAEEEFNSQNKLLTVIQGYLCLVIASYQRPTCATNQYTLYVMKQYGVSGTWNKSYIVRQSDIPRELSPLLPSICANKWGEKLLLNSPEITIAEDAYHNKHRIREGVLNKTIKCSLVVCFESLLMQNGGDFGAVDCTNKKKKHGLSIVRCQNR